MEPGKVIEYILILLWTPAYPWALNIPHDSVSYCITDRVKIVGEYIQFKHIFNTIGVMLYIIVFFS